MNSLAEFESFVQQPLVYEQRLISIINDQGQQIYLEDLGQLHANLNHTIKLEGMERYSPELWARCQALSARYNKPVTCHVFRSQEWSHSFPTHTDPDDVLLQVIAGTKVMEVQNIERILQAGDTYFIPANTPHRAINRSSSLMLSFGIENFYVDKL